MLFGLFLAVWFRGGGACLICLLVCGFGWWWFGGLCLGGCSGVRVVARGCVLFWVFGLVFVISLVNNVVCRLCSCYLCVWSVITLLALLKFGVSVSG